MGYGHGVEFYVEAVVDFVEGEMVVMDLSLSEVFDVSVDSVIVDVEFFSDLDLFFALSQKLEYGVC